MRTVLGRIEGHEANGTVISTLFAGTTGLEKAKRLVTEYKTGKIEHMNPELWRAKKIVDSTLHPGTGPYARGETYTLLERALTNVQIRESRCSCLSACPASSSPTSSSRRACSSQD